MASEQLKVDVRLVPDDDTMDAILALLNLWQDDNPDAIVALVPGEEKCKYKIIPCADRLLKRRIDRI